MNTKLIKRATLAVTLGTVLAWPGCLNRGWLANFGSPAFWGTATAVFANNAVDCAVGPCDGAPVSLAEMFDSFLPANTGQVVSQ